MKDYEKLYNELKELVILAAEDDNNICPKLLFINNKYTNGCIENCEKCFKQAFEIFEKRS